MAENGEKGQLENTAKWNMEWAESKTKNKKLNVWSPEMYHFLGPHLEAKKVNSLGKGLRTFQTFQECQPTVS